MKSRAKIVVAACAVVLVVAIAAGAAFGTDPIDLGRALCDASSLDHAIVFEVRLPRVLLAAIAGAGLSIVGVALQSLLRNPLAEPFVLGVSGGSAFGATIAIVLGVSTTTWLGASVVPLGAFAGGVGATLLVHAFASAASGESRGTSILLAGIVVNAIASALITFVKTIVTPAKAQELLFWLMGYVDVPSTGTLVFIALYVALGSFALLADAARLNVLSLGDDAAEHLGIRVRAVEQRAMLASALIVGAIVSVTGLIGFVGLLVPHILRRILGADARHLMPASLLFGGATLVACDLLSRGTFRFIHRELPVGLFTAVLGGPLFLVLLLRSRR